MFEVFHSYETVPFVLTTLTTKIKTDAFFLMVGVIDLIDLID